MFGGGYPHRSGETGKRPRIGGRGVTTHALANAVTPSPVVRAHIRVSTRNTSGGSQG